jgi:hypothetical protein
MSLNRFDYVPGSEGTGDDFDPMTEKRYAAIMQIAEIEFGLSQDPRPSRCQHVNHRRWIEALIVSVLYAATVGLMAWAGIDIATVLSMASVAAVTVLETNRVHRRRDDRARQERMREMHKRR